MRRGPDRHATLAAIRVRRKFLNRALGGGLKSAPVGAIGEHDEPDGMNLEMKMSRLILTCLALCLASGAATAADPKIEAAVKTFEQIAGDEAKLKTYCAMNKLMADIGDDDAKAQAAEGQMDGFMKELGADFEAAMAAGEQLDEKSPDLNTYDAAITKLDEKCPQ